ncbi:hypothetical protein QN277_010373 [Acacia crassicarpa]|uniref:HAT C-terminal dimerisation domain-containing protein n=1 Tax=Acacia crassicarpa TaxID=499986 RepID=A0AAE1M6L2_9FABA|nr:hypothetical protein QN277_010373 [Acacia crassicarpa]
MFTSEEWKSSWFAKTKDGKLIEDVVLNKAFWKDIVTCLKGAYPLVKVLRVVDSDAKPTMGFIYEEIDRAKERIAHAFNNVERGYLPLWDVIDDRWDKQLHRPLHAAGYYLNPQLHYKSSFKVDIKVKRGLYDCMDRMVGDIEEMNKIDTQLEDFKYQRKFFGRAIAKKAINTKAPAEWWESYGFEHPELQQFAIRVLGLTCSASGCERNWSAFEMVHTKRRNRLKQKTTNDVVFVMANSRLAKKNVARKANEYNVDDISSDDDWIVENDENPSNIEDLDVDNLVPTQNEALVEPSNDLELELPNFDEEDFEDGEEDAMLDDDYDLNALID